MVTCSYHDNSTSGDAHMAISFIAQDSLPTHKKIKGGYKFSFPTLLHFLKDLLLISMNGLR